jgi:hypothetical protein
MTLCPRIEKKNEFVGNRVELGHPLGNPLLCHRFLVKRKFDLTLPALRENILTFYADLSVPIETKKDNARWQGVLVSLDQLRLDSPTPLLSASPAK